MRLKDQLKDPVYRKWFATPPKRREDPSPSAPWFVYVQKKKGGKWRRAEVKTYVEGYKYIARNINKYHDMALCHKRREFQPPVVRVDGKRKYKLPGQEHGYYWCPYCRRMTRFRRFAKHHAMPVWASPDDRRCSICGVRFKFIKRYS